MASALRTARAAIAALTAAVALVAVSGAGAVVDGSPLTITTVVLEDGAAVVAGIVDADGGVLEINGVPVQVGHGGDFLATVDLTGDVLVFELIDATAESVQIRVPIDVLLDVGGASVLDDLAAAGIEIDAPVGGFEIIDGQMPLVEGRVVDASNLSVLEVNGTNVLPRVGNDGTFSLIAPRSRESTRHVTITAADRRGVSQTNRYATTSVRSTMTTRAGTSVSVAGAQGLVIAKVRLDATTVKTNRRLAVLVTVKDRRGYLVRGASVTLRTLPAGALAAGSVRTGFTNQRGLARFAYRLRPGIAAAKLPRFLTVSTRASTPRATTALQVKLRLPALAR